MKRRELIKLTITTLLASFSLPSSVKGSIVSEILAEKKYGMLIDLTKCIGCGACVIACSLENTRYLKKTIPLGERTNFYILDLGKYKIPYHKICMHCDNPVCTRVCPTGATYKTPEGPVVVNYSKCIECRYCIYECPYEPNVRYVNEELKAVDKCTLCYHRITKGLRPACVEACPTGARIFGDLKDPKSEISEIIRTKNVIRVGERAGIGPNLYFVLPEGLVEDDIGLPKIRFGTPINNELTLLFKTLMPPILTIGGAVAVLMGLIHILRENSNYVKIVNFMKGFLKKGGD